jgi:hypothetical protein
MLIHGSLRVQPSLTKLSRTILLLTPKGSSNNANSLQLSLITINPIMNDPLRLTLQSVMNFKGRLYMYVKKQNNSIKVPVTGGKFYKPLLLGAIFNLTTNWKMINAPGTKLHMIYSLRTLFQNRTTCIRMKRDGNCLIYIKVTTPRKAAEDGVSIERHMYVKTCKSRFSFPTTQRSALGLPGEKSGANR